MADAMAPYCTSASWLCYPSSGVSQTQIRYHRSLILTMNGLQDNLFFQSKKTAECMKLLLADVRASWEKNLPGKHDAKWIATCSQRFLAMCKRVARAERNESAWLQQALYCEIESNPDGRLGARRSDVDGDPPEDKPGAMGSFLQGCGGIDAPNSGDEKMSKGTDSGDEKMSKGTNDESEDEGDGCDKVPSEEEWSEDEGDGCDEVPSKEDLGKDEGDGFDKVPDPPVYWYGYDVNQEMAWRIRADGKPNKKVYVRDGYSRPDDLLWATWPDGGFWQVDDVTVNEFKTKQLLERSTKGSGDLFTCTDGSGVKYTIMKTKKTKTVDGVMLLAFRSTDRTKDGKGQILQLMTKEFDSSEAAIAAMTDAVKVIAEGKIGDSRKERYALLQDVKNKYFEKDGKPNGTELATTPPPKKTKVADGADNQQSTDKRAITTGASATVELGVATTPIGNKKKKKNKKKKTIKKAKKPKGTSGSAAAGAVQEEVAPPVEPDLKGVPKRKRKKAKGSRFKKSKTVAFDKADKPESNTKNDKNDNGDKNDKGDKPESNDKNGKGDKPESDDENGKGDKPESNDDKHGDVQEIVSSDGDELVDNDTADFFS
ncbi:unnamed protein product [Prorocentrum cordatum]|uniref:Uncharacterized protein n=1 Tax=Prorocentrum cordatum TaxID=2364126 RepID=A0ABN9U2C7_9DINO|nr:unnamed protein product [Polarella glacialis]